MKISNLITGLAIILLAATFTSCEKQYLSLTEEAKSVEVLPPPPVSLEIKNNNFLAPENEADKVGSNVFAPPPAISTEKEDNNFVQKEKETGNTSLDAMNVSIVLGECSNGGFTLTVDLSQTDISEDYYKILWYKNSETSAFAEGPLQQCLCGTGVRIEVVNILTGEVGKDSLDLEGC